MIRGTLAVVVPVSLGANIPAKQLDLHHFELVLPKTYLCRLTNQNGLFCFLRIQTRVNVNFNKVKQK